MTFASRCLRRLELAFWAIGISLVGVALGATFDRWNYQSQQERALFSSTANEAHAAGLAEAPRRSVVEEEVRKPAGPLEMFGPPAPAVAPSPRVEPRVEKKERRNAVDPTAFARIEIPRLGVTAIVREGADERTLARAVGLVPGGAYPGQPGNIVLAGHRDTFFRPLRRIKVNDRIRLTVPRDGVYEYRVDSLRVVSPEETSVLDSKGFEELTLVTCYPFRFVGPAPDRFIVSATRVQ